MEIDFIPFRGKDKEAVLSMMKAFNEIDGYPFDWEVGEKNLLYFTSCETLGRLFLMTYQKQHVGYMVLTFGFSFEYKGRDAFIDELFIREEFRNKGIGKKAMDFIEAQCNVLNVNALHLEVEPHNINARKLYADKGFKTSDRQLMTKRIN